MRLNGWNGEISRIDWQLSGNLTSWRARALTTKDTTYHEGLIPRILLSFVNPRILCGWELSALASKSINYNGHEVSRRFDPHDSAVLLGSRNG